MKTLSIFFIFICINLKAQSPDKVYRVKNGSDIRKTIDTRDRYLYEQFQDGKVYFRNGNTSRSPMNYSLFHGEIQFIGPQKDTMLLSDNDFISKIIIRSDTFYYDKSCGHVQAVKNFGKVKLGRQPKLLIAGTEKNAGYSEYLGTSAITHYSDFVNSHGERQKLEATDKLMLRRRFNYFLIDKNHRFSNASRTGIMKLYPGSKKEISDFVKTNETDFLKENDIVKLLEYCQSL